MRVDVAELRSGARPHSSEYYVGGMPWDRVLYAPVPRWTQWGEVDSLLYELDAEIRAAADIIVLRAHGPDADRLLRSSELGRQLTIRHLGRPVFVLRWAAGGYEFHHIAGDEPEVPPGVELLRLLRDAELGALAAQPGVELPEAAEMHYIGPNGRHYGSFVRIGTAIQSIDRLDGVTFWLLEFLDGASIVLLDSWTIMSLGLNLARYPQEGGAIDLQVVGVECVRNYDEPEGQLESRLIALQEHLLEGGTPASRAVIVMSTVSTGGLVAKLRRVCEQVALPYRTIALYAPDEQHVEKVFRLRPELGGRWEDREDCPRCQTDTAHVRINPSTYHLDITANVEKAIITRDLMTTLQPFFDAYRGRDIFRVHAWQADDQTRHHMVDVDVLKMRNVPVFQSKLEKILRERPPFDVVLSPRHDAAIAVAAEVARLSGRPLITRLPGELESLPGDERAALAGGKVLLVDDVLVSGTRLHVYRQALQRAKLTDDKSALGYLVGLARPTSNAKLRTIRNTVHGPVNFDAVDTVLLPHWDEDACPWCWERDQLRQLGPELERSPYLTARLQTLEDPVGLTDRPFLRWTEDNEEFWDLGPQSLLHVDTELEVFVNIAAAMQELRGAAKGLNETFSTPVARVMDPDFFISGTYYVPVIKAAVLRAGHVHDLRAHREDPLVRREIIEKLTQPEWHGLFPELAFAIARGQIPVLPNLSASGGLLEGDGSDTVLTKLLRRLVALGR
jgi:hypothetical protein